ncbi:glycosyltransferase family 61 protein [Salaquimonas pukyongi]|uniref:glycosyltransferase family 61 protein n=1 Tax=Salaquimonas pukyongi TaxID=2712698 RepID=UPI0009FB7FBC|nr:glycosyltransferase 61 family protein [Salaquimonas pukyongi]
MNIDVEKISRIDYLVQDCHSYLSSAPKLHNYFCEDRNLNSWISSIFSRRQVIRPGEGFSYIKNGKILRGRYIFSEDDCIYQDSILDESKELVKKFFVSTTGVSNLCEHVTVPELPIISIFKNGCQNYGHFLLEIAPKLVNVKSVFPNGVNLVVPEDAAWSIGIIELICDVIKIKCYIIICRDDIIYRFRGIYFHTPVSKHNTEKSITALKLSNFILGEFANYRKVSENNKVFFSRGPDEKRRVANHKDLERVFLDRGWKLFYPGEESFRRQVEVASSASFVAGQMGAGLSNILFSPVNSKILMLDNSGYDYFFWDIACLKKLEFHWHYSNHVQMFDYNVLREGFTVDIDSLCRVLDEYF